MFYIGITVKDKDKDKDKITFNADIGLNYENGIIYARKGNTAESLLIPAWELETFKGHIRRLPKEIYDTLNDDFGFHRLKSKPRLILKNKSV